MISFDEIQKYLPQYLSATSQHSLFEELKRYPDNMDQRLYTNYAIEDGTIYQGDGINGLMVINFLVMRQEKCLSWYCLIVVILTH